MLGAGPEAFQALLEGARTMDRHFQTEPPESNLPVLMGLVAVWNRNFLNIPARALVPYGARLALLPAWAQQLEMESNGKSVTRTGEAVAWHTAPVLFGGTGPETQHSFFQHLHQGTQPVATDFILPLRPDLMRAKNAWDALPAEEQSPRKETGPGTNPGPDTHAPGRRTLRAPRRQRARPVRGSRVG